MPAMKKPRSFTGSVLQDAHLEPQLWEELALFERNLSITAAESLLFFTKAECNDQQSVIREQLIRKREQEKRPFVDQEELKTIVRNEWGQSLPKNPQLWRLFGLSQGQLNLPLENGSFNSVSGVSEPGLMQPLTSLSESDGLKGALRVSCQRGLHSLTKHLLARGACDVVSAMDSLISHPYSLDTRQKEYPLETVLYDCTMLCQESEREQAQCTALRFALRSKASNPRARQLALSVWEGTVEQFECVFRAMSRVILSHGPIEHARIRSKALARGRQFATEWLVILGQAESREEWNARIDQWSEGCQGSAIKCHTWCQNYREWGQKAFALNEVLVLRASLESAIEKERLPTRQRKRI